MIKCLSTFLFLVFMLNGLNAQKISKIFVNLYTDSLKKGTYNYINVDGLTELGKYVPLDSIKIKFESTFGKFYGNSLFLNLNDSIDKIDFTISLKSDKNVVEKFTLWVKKIQTVFINTSNETKINTENTTIESTKKSSRKKRKKS